MASDLESTFGELGLTQYLDAFVEQGFDAWDTILDIQESDLDALGVKLGHRRKLQRRIANARGISPTVSLVAPARPNVEETKPEARPEPSRVETNQEPQGVAKRKYRRHPKPDDKAPERPPSAYVLFSNKMREDLKSQNLSFTEIAKLVGENWQSLAASEKESFESQANSDKEKYHRDLMEYKKTPEYKKYMQYLQEFKDKQAKLNQANDTSKRPRLEPSRIRQGSSSSTATPGGNTSSGSERLQGSEPPPSRQERLNSIASIAESQNSSTTPTVVSQSNSIEDNMSSPGTKHLETSPRDSHRRHARGKPSWRESGRAEKPRQHLPSLSDMLDDGRMGVTVSTASEGNPYSSGFMAPQHPRSVPEPPNVIPAAPSRAPLIRHEPSSSGSIGSISPATSFARTPGEGSLPIHALLSNHSMAGPVGVVAAAFDQTSPPPLINGTSPSPTEPPRLFYGHHISGHRGYGFHPTPSTSQLMKAERLGDGDALMMPAPDMIPNGHNGSRPRLDGVSALLRAGEMVEKHDRDV